MSMWLALGCALGLHLLLLLLPITETERSTGNKSEIIELQLTTVAPQPAEPEPIDIQEEIDPTEIAPQISERIVENAPAPPPQDEPKQKAVERVIIKPIVDQKQRRLSRTILSARLQAEESEVDKIFGRPPDKPDQFDYAEFSRPIGQNMVTMLNPPMQELPFAYTPGLVNFAYDPGVKGDLQRFWDVITPEFGWRTDNGTEFKCIMILVIVACGWK